MGAAFSVLLLAAVLPTPAPTPVLPAVPVVAPGYAAPAVATRVPQIVGVTQQPFVGISLQNAIGMAMVASPDVAIALANRRIAGYQVAAAKGAYDLRFSVQPQYQYVTQAPQNPFFAGPDFGPIVQKTTSVNGSLQGTTPAGQQWTLSVSGKQTYDNTTINSFNPYYPTIFSAGFTQPLGRGRGITEAARTLQIAALGAQTSAAQTRLSVSSTIAQIENAYWDLVSAWRNVAIQEESLRDTIAQQRSNVRLARAGASAPIDVVQSNAQIAVFQQNVFAALQNVATLQNQLKLFLTRSGMDPIWNANLVPVTPVLQLPSAPSLLDLVTTALRNRPEIAQAAAARRSADVNLQYAQNQLKPQVDLQLGYTSNGFAGSPTNPANSPFLESSIQQVIVINELIAAVNRTLPPSQQITPLPTGQTRLPAYLVGGLNESIKNLLLNKFPVYSAGVLVTFPLGNTTAKANLGIAQEQERIAQLQEASAVAHVTVDVRNAVQGYQSSLSRLAAARAARRASEQVLASEQRRFRAGESTTFLVLQREVEVADNRGRELEAQTDLNKAVVELQRATGTILQANNVTLTSVGEGTP